MKFIKDLLISKVAYLLISKVAYHVVLLIIEVEICSMVYNSLLKSA